MGSTVPIYQRITLMTLDQWFVVGGIITGCAAISIFLVRLTKKPGRHVADPRAQKNLSTSVQRDTSWKPRASRTGDPWRAQPPAASRKSDSLLSPVGIAAAPGDNSASDSCPGGTE